MSGKSGVQDKPFCLGFEGKDPRRIRGVPEVEFISFVLELSCWSQIGAAVCPVRLGAEGRAATLES